jgi:hypothetical protein
MTAPHFSPEASTEALTQQLTAPLEAPAEHLAERLAVPVIPGNEDRELARVAHDMTADLGEPLPPAVEVQRAPLHERIVHRLGLTALGSRGRRPKQVAEETTEADLFTADDEHVSDQPVDSLTADQLRKNFGIELLTPEEVGAKRAPSETPSPAPAWNDRTKRKEWDQVPTQEVKQLTHV